MKQPSVVIIPYADRSQTLLSVAPSGGIFIFRRSTSGTELLADKIIAERGVDYARRHYRGDKISYLSEADSTNLYLYSSDYSNAIHTRTGTVVATDDVSVSPDGKYEAGLLKPNTEASGSKYTQQNATLTTIEDHTFSVYLKSSGEEFITLRMFLDASPYTSYTDTKFSLLDGSIVSGTLGSATIEDAGNGWYRATVTGLNTLTGSHEFRLELDSAGAQVDDGVLVWGGQVEASSVATSYIPTVATTESRDGDNIWFSDNFGDMTNNHLSAYFNLKMFKTGDASSMFTMGDGTSANKIQITSQANSTDIAINVTKDSDVFSYIADIGGYGNDVKVMVVCSDSSTRISVNGVIVASDTSTTLGFTGLDRIINAQYAYDDNSTKFKGLINDIRFYPMALSDAEANYITTI